MKLYTVASTVRFHTGSALVSPMETFLTADEARGFASRWATSMGDCLQARLAYVARDGTVHVSERSVVDVLTQLGIKEVEPILLDAEVSSNILIPQGNVVPLKQRH